MSVDVKQFMEAVKADARRWDERPRAVEVYALLTRDAESCRLWVSSLRLLEESVNVDIETRDQQAATLRLAGAVTEYDAHLQWRRKALRFRGAIRNRIVEAEYELRRRTGLSEMVDKLIVDAFHLLRDAAGSETWLRDYQEYKRLRLGQIGPLNDGSDDASDPTTG